MSLKTLLGDAIETGFNELDNMEVGTDKYKTTSEQLTKLTDRIIELEKFESEEENRRSEREIEEKNRQIENDLRLKQMRQEQIDRYIKHGITAVSVLGGIILTVWGAKASWRFEETGTITSTAGRKFISNLFFKK